MDTTTEEIIGPSSGKNSFKSLPPELAARIFSLYIEAQIADMEIQANSYLYGLLEDADEDEEDEEEDEEDAVDSSEDWLCRTRMRLRLALVCTQWRDVIFNADRTWWSTIDINFRDRGTQDAPPILNQWVIRPALTHPIKLKIKGISGRENNTDLFNFIFDHRARWKKTSFKGDACFMQLMGTVWGNRLQSKGSPILDDDNTYNIPPKWVFQQAEALTFRYKSLSLIQQRMLVQLFPKVQKLKMIGERTEEVPRIKEVLIGMANLTTLKIEGSWGEKHGPTIVDILETLPALRVLSLKADELRGRFRNRPHGQTQSLESEIATITHRNLRELSVAILSWVSLVGELQKLALPALRVFRYEADDHWPWDGPIRWATRTELIILRHSFGSQLQELDIARQAIKHRDFADLLVSLPSLRSLRFIEIGHDVATEGAFDYLNGQNLFRILLQQDHSTQVLPHLSKLVFVACVWGYSLARRRIFVDGCRTLWLDFTEFVEDPRRFWDVYEYKLIHANDTSDLDRKADVQDVGTTAPDTLNEPRFAYLKNATLTLGARDRRYVAVKKSEQKPSVYTKAFPRSKRYRYQKQGNAQDGE